MWWRGLMWRVCGGGCRHTWVRRQGAHNKPVPSMSRRGNCRDNAVAESSFSSLQKEWVRRRTYRPLEEARAELFSDIAIFYNVSGRHSRLGNVSPEAFESASRGVAC